MLILIPTYNCSESLEYTLKHSVREKSGVKYLVVDNLSTDSTRNVAEKYDVEVYINKENIGRVGNWNRCIEIAKERQYTFCKLLFAGDILHKEALDIYDYAFKDKNIGFVCGAYLVKDTDTERRITHFDREKIISPEESHVFNLSKRNWYSPPSCQAYRVSELKQIQFNPSIPWIADWKFSIDVAKNTHVFYTDKNIATFNVLSRNYYNVAKNKLSSRLEELTLISYLDEEAEGENKFIYKYLAQKLTLREILRITILKFYQKIM